MIDEVNIAILYGIDILLSNANAIFQKPDWAENNLYLQI